MMIIEDGMKDGEMTTYERNNALNEKQTAVLTATQHEKWHVTAMPIDDCTYSSHSLSTHLFLCLILQHRMHLAQLHMLKRQG